MAASEGDLSTTEIPRSNSNGKLTDGDFVQAAGLQRSEHSGKKSSVEKLLGKCIQWAFLENVCIPLPLKWNFQGALNLKIRKFQGVLD